MEIRLKPAAALLRLIGHFGLIGWVIAVVVLLAPPAAQAASGSVKNVEAVAASAKAESSAPATRELDGIMAVRDERGRLVYVNAPPTPVKPAAAASRRTSNLVYWSSKENRWKPVPPPSPSAMQAARNAAEEVMDYVEERTATRTATATKPVRPVQSAAVHTASGEHHKSYNAEVLAELRLQTSGADVQRASAKTSEPTANGQRLTTIVHAVSPQEINDAIERAAARHQVDPNLVRAMIKVESNFNPRAVSKKGAMGLMQLMPATARSLDVNHPFDPNENVDAGVRHLRTLLDNYDGDVRLSLAAYNAGAAAVARHNGVPNIPETTQYVKQITSLYANGGSPVLMSLKARAGSVPVRVFRNSSGVLTMTNQ